jgi:hypothetical protein
LFSTHKLPLSISSVEFFKFEVRHHKIFLINLFKTRRKKYRLLMKLQVKIYLTSSPPTRTERSGLKDTGLKVAEGFSLSEIHQLLSQWLIDTGTVDQSYSCKLQNTLGQPCLLVQAHHKEGWDEIQEFLESHGLIESNAKELSDETEVDEYAQTHPIFYM